MNSKNIFWENYYLLWVIYKIICFTCMYQCSSYACQKLPKGVEDLVKDLYSYFAHSSKRVNILKECQNFLGI